MHPHLKFAPILLLLLAPPLQGQAAQWRPAPSILFASSSPEAAPADTLPQVDTGVLQWQGGLIGAAVGGVMGYGLTVAIYGIDQFGDCDLINETCDEPPPAGILIGATFLGAVIGYLSGSHMARH